MVAGDGSRHAVVTGGAKGIGLAIARRLVREGFALSLLARDEAALATAGRELGAFTARCDVRSDENVAHAFEAAAAQNGPAHVLVANAGLGGPNDPGPGDRFGDLVDTNLVGTYRCVRAWQRHAASGPETRHVVVISSILARIAVPGYTGYSASKAGLLGLVRSFAAELAPANVQVNAICPGWVDTDMAWRGLDLMPGTREEAYAEAMREVPLGRMGRPEDVAGTVAWLVSADARGVTGQTIDQNGGAFMS